MQVIKILLIILFLILPFQALASDNPRKITVSGTSEITLEAQNATIGINIRYVDKQMNRSHTALMDTISKMSKELEKLGLTEKDIKKSIIQQGTENTWESNSYVFKGYYSECAIDINVTDISKIANVYQELANYPSITIHSVDYNRNDEFEVRKKEFEKALIAARKKAEYMAQVYNAKIGKVYSIHEVSSDNYFAPINGAYANISQKANAGSSASQFGNIKITAAVSVEFELTE